MTASRCLLLALLLGLLARAGEPANIRWLPLTPVEAAALADTSGDLHALPLPYTPYNTSRPKIPYRSEVIGDRFQYLADDPVGQVIVYLIGQPVGGRSARLELKLVAIANGRETTVFKRALSPVHSRKVAFLLGVDDLAPGSYRLDATLKGVDGARVIPGWAFSKSGETHLVTQFPAGGVPLLVHAQNHLPDGVWGITTGVPLPRGTADDGNRFVLLENGKRVPAQFSTRAWWYPNGTQAKWLGLAFQARYDRGRPRAYAVKLLPPGEPAPPPASKLSVKESVDHILVHTGAIEFSVNTRRFAGVDDVRLVDADGAAGEPLIKGAGGPFLQDERHYDYTSALEETGSVTIEELGPVKVTIRAAGWYTDHDAETCCIYDTRITAWAGEPRIDIKQRTIITYDTDRKRLRELGVAFKPVGATAWQFGADGKVLSGELPEKETVWLHQDRADHFRLMQGDATPVAEGTRSDGWASIATPNGTILLTARNLWQLFPKEIELGRDRLDVHLWPRHGHDTFTDAEELDWHVIHQLRYAHEGEYLDLRFPQKYYDYFPTFLKEHPNPTARNGCFLESQDTNALAGNGQGLAATLSFSLIFSPGPADRPAAQAALFQQAPHAITDPVYNGLSDVEGRFAGRQPDKFPELERVFDTGYHGFTMSVDILQDYGMWIWADTHNNWSLGQLAPQTHRWWLNAHYQDVWEASFLYWRSGLPWLKDWADANYEHFANVGTVNYDDPIHPLQGHLTGANYHTKGFTPWGSPHHLEHTGDDYVELGAHFINPDAHLFRFLLDGDYRGLQLAMGWFRSLGKVALPPERSREAAVTLGELISYYETTWDPQALPYMRDLVQDILSRPMAEVPAFPAHPMFHDRWVQRYWALTRDPKVIQRVEEWLKPDAFNANVHYGYPQVRAVLWRITGNTDYLTDLGPDFVGVMHKVYANPDDPRLDGFGGRSFFFPTHSWGQMVPWYMQALLDAGLSLPAEGRPPVPIVKAYQPPRGKEGAWFPIDPKRTREPWRVAYATPAGARQEITLTFRGNAYTRYGANQPLVSWLKVEDANGQVLLDTNVLLLSKRPEATLKLDATKNPPPWKLTSNGNGLLSWDGPAESVTLSPEPTK